MARRKRCCSCKKLFDPKALDINDLCGPCILDATRPRCRGCGEVCDTVYCSVCVTEGRADCAHGKRPGECGACDAAADMAYDAARGG